MNIRILGSASGLPTPGKNHSAVYVHSNDSNILFDCGEGTAKQLLRYKLDHNHLDAIVISHFHPDHISGLYMVLQMLYLQKRDKKLSIFLPERIEDFKNTLDLFYTFPARFSFPVEFLYIEDLNTKLPFIEAIASNHLKDYKPFVIENDLKNEFRSFSFMVDEKNQTMLYTSDIKEIDHLRERFSRSNLIILDAAHPDAGSILELINQIAGRIILTHGMSADLILQKESEIEIANENLEISL